MNSPRKPWWQQATALVSLGAGGAITGLAFVPGTADQIASPASIPVTLTALDHATRPAAPDDTAVRSAIVGVANYYLRIAQGKTPAEVEALIWQQDSLDGVDHGESCAAFASMTLQLGAQLVGRQSWVTGGSTYPWPLHDWADVRVDPNPASIGITSVLQDAQAHQRWHPLGDGYEPQPGDWVLFNGHVEVVTKYSGDVLYTVGGDSLPNFSVNAHQYPGPLAAQGVAGFVSNGDLPPATGAAASSSASGQPAQGGRAGGTAGASAPATRQGTSGAATGNLAAIPGTSAVASLAGTGTGSGSGSGAVAGSATPGAVAGTAGAATATLTAESPAIPGMPAAASGTSGTSPLASAAASQGQRPAGRGNPGARPGSAKPVGSPRPAQAGQGAAAEVTIPGMPPAASAPQPAGPSARYRRSQPAPSPSPSPSSSASAGASAAPGTAAQQAFINQVAPGAVAAQRAYGVPAAVTIAQAIDESGWGQSTLATRDNNLFGIKGTGPTGSDALPTQEFQNGQWVTITAQFRVYNDVAESINDHGKLLATSGYYTAAMAAQNAPNTFAQALTGVYATDPNYGTNLISLMRRYNLYRFDPGAQSARAQAAAAAQPTTAQPPAAQSPAAQPTTSQPTTAQPPAAQPRTSQPPAARATTAQPPAAQPRTSQPSAARATTSQPPAAQPPKARPPATPSPTAAGGAAAARPTAQPAASARTSTPPPAAKPASAAPGTSVPSSPTAARRTPSAARPKATRPAPAASQPQAAPTAPPTTPPHPFATPQPSASSASPGGSPAAAATAGQPAIPGVEPAPASTPAHTSAQLRSSSDTTVITELAAVFRPTAAAGRRARTTYAGQQAGAASADQGVPRPASAGQQGLATSGDRPARETAAPKTAAPKTAAPKKAAKRKAGVAKARKAAPRYQPQMPPAVKNAFLASARKPLARAELVYRDVAGTRGISWKLLAACDWMQCEAHPRYSPVRGEKLGTVNEDGTMFRTKSEALTQCARDLIAVADTVYQIDLTVPVELSVLELARVFAAFRWGGLLRLHDTSAMEFPYSVQGLTEQHTNMRWPRIDEPGAPDKPGARFRRPFGAVPVVLSLDYPATV